MYRVILEGYVATRKLHVDNVVLAIVVLGLGRNLEMVNITLFCPLIGCDTTSAFAGSGKRSASDIFGMHFHKLHPPLQSCECILTDKMLYLTTEHLKA